jgi:hypothetical protein
MKLTLPTAFRKPSFVSWNSRAGSDGKNPLGKEAPEAVDDFAFLTGIAETFGQGID